jgi:hypothetical protein
MILLSFGLSPGSQGGIVKPIDVFLDLKLVSLLKETLDRPFSISNVASWEILVRGLSAALRNENMVAYLL